jgi:glutathione synthase/RimK-type ligase-like ATP-grasp enzyme
VFSAAIHSQQSRRTRHDWRRYDRSRTPYTRHELPSEVADQLVTLVRRMKMRYGAIDLIYTQDGRYVFVEINPNGQFLFVEQATSLPISAAIADALSVAEPKTSPGVCHDAQSTVCLA